MPVDWVVVGLDNGGTMNNGTILDSSGRFLVDRLVEAPSNVREGPDKAIGSLVDSVHQVLELTGVPMASVRAVGLDTPGPASRDGVISSKGATNFGHAGWRGYDIRGALADRIGLPVIYNNDGNSAALYAHHVRFGVESSQRGSVAAIVGTGLGGGVVEGGQVIKGAAGMAGELGHVPIPLDGLLDLGQPMPACNCGLSGDAESVASLTGIQNNLLPYWLTRYPEHELGGLPIGRAAKLVRKYAEDGDEMALAIFRQQAMAIGRLFTLAANFLDPDVYFLGGGVVEAAPHFRDWFFAEVRAGTLLREEQARAAEITLVPDLDMAGARGSAVAARDWFINEGQDVLPRPLLSGASRPVIRCDALVRALLFVLEDQPAYLEVELLRVGEVIDDAQRLVLAGRFQDELAVSEDPAERGPLEAHVRHLGERHHVHFLRDQAGRQQHPLRRDDEVVLVPLEDLDGRPQQDQRPQDPDDEDHGPVAVRDGVGQPARDGQPDEQLEDRPDQHSRMLMNGDDLAFMGQKVPIDLGRHRVGVRNQPHRGTSALDGREEVGQPARHRGEEGPDVAHDVGRSVGLLNNPPDDERDC
jgi:glucokinase